jgi:hypothetical protein
LASPIDIILIGEKFMKAVRRLTKKKSRISLKKRVRYIDFGIFLVYNFIMISQNTVTFDRQAEMPIIIKKGAVPPTQDDTQPADKIKNGEKVCFFLHAFAGY